MKHKVAFAGFRHGHIETLYKRILSDPEFEIAAGCEENEEAAEAAKFRGIKINYSSFETMLKNADFDILAVGDYYGIRGKRAIAGLNAGKHVIADKPLCTSLDELQKIRRISTEKKLAVGIMLDMRRNKNVAAVRQLINNGVIGRIHQIQFTGQHQLSWGSRPTWYFEPGKHGGTINDIAIHGTDLVEYLTGHRITELISARAWNAFADKAPGFKDSAQGMFALDDGCGVIFDVSYAAPASCKTPFYWHFSIWGEKGVLDFHSTSNGITQYICGNREGKVIPPAEPTCDYLASFLTNVEGREDVWNTANFLSITETTLRLQQMSDMKYGPEF